MAQLSRRMLLHNTTVQCDGVVLHNHTLNTTYNIIICQYRYYIKSGVVICSSCQYVNVMQNDDDDDYDDYDDGDYDSDNVT
jgi:hypothetical protein